MTQEGERAKWVRGLSRQQRRALEREAEKRGSRLPPMTRVEERAYRAAGQLSVTDVWARAGLDLVGHS